MEHGQLGTFTAVARDLSFTRAAGELGYVQSAVTAQVKALKKELGVPLFDRLGRRVVLTEAGKDLHGYAAKMLDLSEEARAAVSRGSGGVSGTPSGNGTVIEKSYCENMSGGCPPGRPDPKIVGSSVPS